MDSGWSDREIAHYVCHRTRQGISLDGRLQDRAWKLAPRSPRFVDVVSGSPGIYDTRSAALWDDDNLYIAFWVEEPYVTAELTERDDFICLENDVEVFIDGGDTYYELELNALGTIYEVFFIWQDAYKRGGRFDIPEFDLIQRKALSFGGNNDRSGAHFWKGTHPRGNRWAFLDWDLPGIEVATHIDGALNDTSQPDKGWTCLVKLPWSGMAWLADGRSLPPQDGDAWRLFIGRYEKFDINGREVHAGWSWNRVATGDNHMPERFTQFRFSETCVEDL